MQEALFLPNAGSGFVYQVPMDTPSYWEIRSVNSSPFGVAPRMDVQQFRLVAWDNEGRPVYREVHGN